ncbi:hypothetical protein [Allokutzneria oryzae]|uniref:Uncharacterized protein n=1 Tax=Allokutzneria oryzae TaxID=1378989 RepID=A0ABV5ZZF8_9PSEU
MAGSPPTCSSTDVGTDIHSSSAPTSVASRITLCRNSFATFRRAVDLAVLTGSARITGVCKHGTRVNQSRCSP